MRNRVILVSSIMLLLLPALACTITLPSVSPSVGELREESIRVPLDGAARADIDISFGAGELLLKPGAAEGLLEADFVYNIDTLKPVVKKERTDDHLMVNLRLEAEGLSLNFGEKTRNKWDIRLNDQVPMSLGLDLGAARGRFDLGGLRLTDVRIRTSAADVEVEWSEPNPEALEVLKLDAGAASLKMRRLGNAHFNRMDFTGGAGNFDLDFSGDWQESAQVNIDAGLSNLRLVVPPDIGVRVNTGDKPLTNIDANDFHQRGDDWVNDSYGESDVELVISIDIGLGNLTLMER